MRDRFALCHCADQRHGDPRDAGEENDESSVTILPVGDSETKSVFGHVVPQKGIDSKRFAVDAIVNDILWLEHTSRPSSSS